MSQLSQQARATGAPPARTILAYVVFAAASILVNVGVQELVYRSVPINPLAFAMAAGTAAGFATKYVLDKRFIFADPYVSTSREVHKIGLYAVGSVFTTLLFWSFELAFWAMWPAEIAKYVGALIGLSLGYAIKFEIDRRFVFTDRQTWPG